jgi:quinol monooxygenase YgiN
MTTLFVRHQVSNFDNWKKIYDELGATREKMGVSAASVHRDGTDPNTVMVTHRFPNIGAATAFANSEELKAGMGRAGVTSQPEMWFTDDVEHTAH